MNTSEERHCKYCGAIVPLSSSEELCPACLLSGAIGPAGSRAETLTPAPGPSTSDERFSEFPFDFGGYQLLGFLGSGGMGTVYEAVQTSTGRRVALKMLAQQLDSPDLRHRFLREGRLAAGVNHPNSLYVFGSEEIEGVPVITMEIAGSGTLKDKLKKRGPLPAAESVDAILDVIEGLEAAYKGGVLHRDIKPSNCFVSPDGSVKVGDYGLSVSTLAKDDSYMTATGVFVGTPAYAAPEQLRGDEPDVRADIYSVGATLYTLLTGRAPFEGENAVQVVANVFHHEPELLPEQRKDVPPGLAGLVKRCLAKEPDQRYPDYSALRDALLPFSSQEPEPASITVRVPAGWIDYLIAFLVPYVAFMLSIGNEKFHFGFLMDRTLSSTWYYLTFLALGVLYFALTEGIWGAGLGKRLKGLQVVTTDGRVPGLKKALIRILLPILSIEGVRIPILMASISATHINDLTTSEIVLYSAVTSICPWIPVLFLLRARRQNRFATVWDLASRTRVVIRPKVALRPKIKMEAQLEKPLQGSKSIGPYRLLQELDRGNWLLAIDPVLRREVWLLRQTSVELSPARKSLARCGRLRWLQQVETPAGIWDAYEAVQGVPFSRLVQNEGCLPWSTLRHWLHDLASELWSASGDETLPSELGLDHVWINQSGQAILLDRPWPDSEDPSRLISTKDVAGQQLFLNTVAAHVDSTSLPLHARPLMQNLREGKFEKLSFLAGTLRGFLHKRATVSKGTRAGSIFMLPLYIWIMVFVGTHRGADWLYEMIGTSLLSVGIATTIFVLLGSSLIQLLSLPFGTTVGHSVYRLAVVDRQGRPASIPKMLFRWAIIWLPLLVPGILAAAWLAGSYRTAAVFFILGLILLWLCAASNAVVHPNRGLHDRIADTWVVRR